MITQHEPVLLKEVVEELHIKNQGRPAERRGKYIDATLGAGGYTKAILEAGGEVLGIDTDTSMLNIAKENLGEGNFKLVNGNFRDIKKIAEENGFNEVDGIVFDLGVSNVHFMDETRGFSFKNPEADLDMRLDFKSQALRASDLLNALRREQLQEILGRSLANKIIEFREDKKFEKVKDFLELFPEKKFGDRVHPATKAFMALRVAVNSELDNLRETLPQAYELLKPASPNRGEPGGRLAVVSFNSDEDRIVKEFAKSKGDVGKITRPSTDEVNRNPKSRSAILRVIIK